LQLEIWKLTSGKLKLWNLESGIWNLEFEMWNVKFEIWNVEHTGIEINKTQEPK